jgi:PAS domain S-box-containing protein
MNEAQFSPRSASAGDQQALRVRRFLMAAATYVAAVAMMALGVLLKLWDNDVLAVYVLIVLGANTLFYVLLRTGLNQRLADPSLTTPQIAVAVGALLYTSYHAGPARGIVLLWVLLIFMFAVFRLRSTRLWPLAALTWVAYGGVVGLLVRQQPQTIHVPLEIFQWVVLGVVLAWFTFVGGHIGDMRAKLERNEAFYRSMWETAHDAILITGGAGVIEYANPAASRMLGHAAPALAGMPAQALLAQAASAEGSDAFRQYIADDLETPGIDTLELTLARADGREFHAEVSMGEMTVEGRRACILFIRDISARKQTEQALLTARNWAESANRVKTQFLTNMTHEIRTPLNGIIGMAEILGQEPLNPAARGYAGKIHRAGRALLGVVNDVFDFSKIEAGQLDVEREVFELPRILQDIHDLYAESARGKHVELQWDLPRTLPQHVFGDPARLRQVLSNLVGNAIKFTDHGHVRLSAAADGADGIRFEVSDTGVGIEPAAQAVIFDPFSQADGSSTRRFGGAGLGLAITRRIVELMGGQIGLTSEPGKGSCFWLVIPLPRSSQRTLAAAIPAASPTPGRFKGRRVLLVEDDESNAEIATVLLARLGPEISHAANGALALAACREQTFDLVFMDCQMPVMDGLEATRQIRAMEKAQVTPRRTPIVALTAHSFDGYREQCLAADMDDYMTKPVSTEAFAAAMSRWLAQTAAPAPA